MTVRVLLVAVLGAVAVIAVIQPSLSEGTVHGLHIAGLVLGALDVLLVAVSLLADGHGH